MNKLELGIVGIALLIVTFLGGMLEGHHLKTESDKLAVAKQEQQQKDNVKTVTQGNVTLASAAKTVANNAAAKLQQIKNQSPQTRIVYVRVQPKPNLPAQPPVYTAVSSDVYVTVGAQRLFDSSFGLFGSPSSATGTDAASADLPSAFTVSDYEQTTVTNAVACYQNQQQLTLLQRYIIGLQDAGWVKK